MINLEWISALPSRRPTCGRVSSGAPPAEIELTLGGRAVGATRWQLHQLPAYLSSSSGRPSCLVGSFCAHSCTGASLRAGGSSSDIRWRSRRRWCTGRYSQQHLHASFWAAHRLDILSYRCPRLKGLFSSRDPLSCSAKADSLLLLELIAPEDASSPESKYLLGAGCAHLGGCAGLLPVCANLLDCLDRRESRVLWPLCSRLHPPLLCYLVRHRPVRGNRLDGIRALAPCISKPKRHFQATVPPIMG